MPSIQELEAEHGDMIGLKVGFRMKFDSRGNIFLPGLRGAQGEITEKEFTLEMVGKGENSVHLHPAPEELWTFARVQILDSNRRNNINPAFKFPLAPDERLILTMNADWNGYYIVEPAT